MYFSSIIFCIKINVIFGEKILCVSLNLMRMKIQFHKDDKNVLLFM